MSTLDNEILPRHIEGSTNFERSYFCQYTVPNCSDGIPLIPFHLTVCSRTQHVAVDVIIKMVVYFAEKCLWIKLLSPSGPLI